MRPTIADVAVPSYRLGNFLGEDARFAEAPCHEPRVESLAQRDGVNAMIDVSSIDELARRLAELVPAGISEAKADLTDNFRDTLRAGMRKLDLVTRDEFDVQRCVLLRTREKVEALEARVAQLEQLLQTQRH